MAGIASPDSRMTDPVLGDTIAVLTERVECGSAAMGLDDGNAVDCTGGPAGQGVIDAYC